MSAQAAHLPDAVAAHRAGALETAERGYLAVLAADPDHPDANHFLGVLRHQQQRSDEATALIGRAAAAMPTLPDPHNNLGNVHKECGRLAEAEACYRRVLRIDPAHVPALGNLAVVLEAQGRHESAFKAYGLLLTVAPGYAHGHYLLGLFLRQHARAPEHAEQAAVCFRTATSLDPGHLRALEALGVTLYMLGRHDDAGQVYRDWLERQPDNPVPAHMLAACGLAPAPPRATDAYVREVFDGFAASFDEQLVGHLDYRAPQLLVDALRPVLAAGAADVLDAGCGTGLCGPLLRARARRLAGVDLSPRMLDRARARAVYDVLDEGELTAYLRDHPAAFDIVVSADTLVYFGDLGGVAHAAATALRDGGTLAFTVEALDAGAGGDAGGDGVRLGASGRYLHTRAHIERALAQAGFADVALRADTLRRESGADVTGWVVVARKRAMPGF